MALLFPAQGTEETQGGRASGGVTGSALVMKVPNPNRWFWQNIATPFVATRLMLVVVGYLTLQLMQHSTISSPWEFAPDGRLRTTQFNSGPDPFATDGQWLANIFARWDSAWYMSLARNGYQLTPGKECNAGFFPLYPSLIWLVKPLFGHQAVAAALAGITVSNVALLGALVVFAALVRLDHDEETAARAVGYLLIFPATHFMSAVYTESLFFLLTISAFYFARRERWWLAGAMAALAAVTRFQGATVGIALVLEYLHQRGYRWRAIRLDALALLLPAVTFGADMWWLWHQFGDPLGHFTAQKAWHQHYATPWALLGYATNEVFSHGLNLQTLEYLVTLAFIAFTVVAWWKMRPSYALYATLSVGMLLVAGFLSGAIRYMMVVFPGMILLAQMGRHPIFERSYVPLSTGLAALTTALFVMWRWVG